MFVIFLLSSQPAETLPNLGWADSFFKKGGHMLGYGLLALTYWHGFGWDMRKRSFAWLLVVLYAATDEYHQSFVPGRHPSVWDVLVFDSLGAMFSLWVATVYLKQKRPEESA